MLKHSFSLHDVYFKFYVKSDAEQLPRLILQEGNIWSDKPYELISDPDNKYYQTIQYKIFATIHNQEINIADGGMVDWTRQLTGNKKHRLLISGVGLELMQRLLT
jgi:hypothetical protein